MNPRCRFIIPCDEKERGRRAEGERGNDLMYLVHALEVGDLVGAVDEGHGDCIGDEEVIVQLNRNRLKKSTLGARRICNHVIFLTRKKKV